MSEALWIVVPLLLIGAAPAIYFRRKGASWMMTAFIVFFSQAIATGIAFLIVLVAYDYVAMPRAPADIVAYALPRLAILTFFTAGLVLAFVHPRDKTDEG